MTGIRHLQGETFHGRKGGPANNFRYGVDYVLLDPDRDRGPALFARNRAGLVSLHDTDHGGAPTQGRSTDWVREVLAERGLPGEKRILLLAQPRVLGHVFNPVSFWLCHDETGALRVVIAEVSNTYGDRHSYLCHRDDLAPMTATDEVKATKIFYVSPFQPVEGEYAFRFDITEDRIAIRIDYTAKGHGLVATLAGPVVPLTNSGIIAACLRRPLGSRRVLALIHWQALKLWWKGVAFRNRPLPPADEVTR
ncbi:DUF1365 domain-containing protein [Tabrizicola sp. J26]|uniref:DUF1365 domain-containing protein n=1 Tax=Alitabrizicola rongguiensis TaxID=2909234 RepID=UPI001F357927|nr:DUF1365 domain-containing protein [Tabrizicola rongguiensis]MCF1710551.1 DUF1365 domain-containing protein [Tabrizicola rongguiensis]